MVKHLDFECPQVVQKPFALSFHVPVLLSPRCARGSRVIFPSGVKFILNLVPEGVVAVKAWPVKIRLFEFRSAPRARRLKGHSLRRV